MIANLYLQITTRWTKRIINTQAKTYYYGSNKYLTVNQHETKIGFVCDLQTHQTDATWTTNARRNLVIDCLTFSGGQ